MDHKKHEAILLGILCFLVIVLSCLLKANPSSLKWKPVIQKAFAFVSYDFVRGVDSDKSFSLIVLPDTQKYSDHNPKLFCKQTEWIVENKEKMNVMFVSHMGDIVDESDEERQWEAASRCMKILEGEVPHAIVPGNHDLENGNRRFGFASYNYTFPTSRYNFYPWYGGNFKENQNSYQIVEKEGTTFLFLNLEIEASDDVLSWAKRVLENYPEAYAVVTTHKYLIDSEEGLDDELNFGSDGNSGEGIWNKLIRENCQVKMVLSGHYHSVDGEHRIQAKNKCGENVDQIIQDYQGRENGGAARLRIYTFTPSENIIEVSTYSPHTHTFEKDADSQFTLEFGR